MIASALCVARDEDHVDTQRLVLYYGHVGRWPGLVRMGRFTHDLRVLRDLPDGFTVEIAAIDGQR
jgi:hypothetical protein